MIAYFSGGEGWGQGRPMMGAESKHLRHPSEKEAVISGVAMKVDQGIFGYQRKIAENRDRRLLFESSNTESSRTLICGIITLDSPLSGREIFRLALLSRTPIVSCLAIAYKL